MARWHWYAAAVTVGLLTPTTAEAQLAVTYAARACPTYDAIAANLARNDIQESLQDLGANTSYTSGQAIDPNLEASAQSRCRPLPGWRFTLGRGYRTRAVTGSWGSLSIVTNPFADSIVTRDSVPLLNATGADTGRRLEGAVTIPLTSTQANLAAQRNALWLQGGTTTDPVLFQPYPGQYGFGALRCAVDNLNGDNVEYVSFPLGVRHVFCFAYYVTPPPSSGTIVVRKVVDAPADVAAHDFPFEGSLTFNAGGRFSLDAAPGRVASQTFFRAAVPPGGTPWSVREIVEPGWALIDHGCASQTGASAIAVPAASSQADITLAAGDTVTCTYRNGLEPAPSGLTFGKVTRGAIGRTNFLIRGPALDATAPVDTTATGVPVYEELRDVPPGSYEISESPVELAGGRWTRRSVRCNGRIVAPFSDPLPLTVQPGAGVVCLFLNEFVPEGSIRIRKITRGDTGTTTFTIRPVEGDPRVSVQEASTTREGAPVTATGDATDLLTLGTYEIQEKTPTGSADGRWELESVLCNGVPFGSAQGRVRIRLTEDEPDVTCTFTDAFTRGATTQPDKPGGGGDGAPGGESGSNPETNLRVTKRVSPTAIVRGQAARYTVVIANTGSVTARDVIADELQPPTQRAVRIEAPRGVRCRGTRPLRCRLGDIAPGARVTLRATYTTPLSGRVVNRIAIHTSTAETRLSDNRASAVLRVIPRRARACAATRTRC